jgi:hypothetical protein
MGRPPLPVGTAGGRVQATGLPSAPAGAGWSQTSRGRRLGIVAPSTSAARWSEAATQAA